ncbi:head maturation protease, ClpP-related [Mitsuokella sp.]
MKKCWKIRNQESSTEEAEMLIYGTISDETWWGDEVTPKQFAEDLNSLDGKDLCVRINSGGGDVFAAVAMYNQLKTYRGNVNVRIDGLAASAATIIACAGKKVIMPNNALYMIHNPAMFAFDCFDAKTMRDFADQLDTVKQTIINTYLTRSSLSEDELSQKMDEETWMTADEAKDFGFVDEIDAEETVTNSIRDGRLFVNSVSCDLSKFKNTAKIEEILHRKNGKNAKNKAERDGESMNDNDLLKKIKNLLGVSNDSSEDQPDNGDGQPDEGEEKPSDGEDPEKNPDEGGDNSDKGKDEPDDPVNHERQRMLALDALDDHKGGAVTQMVNAAKKNGASAEQIKPFLDIVRAQNAENEENGKAVKAIKDLISDNLESGADGVKAPVPQNSDAAKRQADIDAVVAFANRK